MLLGFANFGITDSLSCFYQPVSTWGITRHTSKLTTWFFGCWICAETSGQRLGLGLLLKGPDLDGFAMPARTVSSSNESKPELTLLILLSIKDEHRQPHAGSIWYDPSFNWDFTAKKAKPESVWENGKKRGCLMDSVDSFCWPWGVREISENWDLLTVRLPNCATGSLLADSGDSGSKTLFWEIKM